MCSAGRAPGCVTRAATRWEDHMERSPRAARRALTRVALTLVCALAVCLGAAAAASAAPPEPTLTVAQL